MSAAAVSACNLRLGAAPFALFAIFISPLLSNGAAADGRLSIQRAYTPAELKAILTRALEGSDSHVEHCFALLCRQILTFDYKTGKQRGIILQNIHNFPILQSLQRLSNKREFTYVSPHKRVDVHGSG